MSIIASSRGLPELSRGIGMAHSIKVSLHLCFQWHARLFRQLSQMSLTLGASVAARCRSHQSIAPALPTAPSRTRWPGGRAAAPTLPKVASRSRAAAACSMPSSETMPCWTTRATRARAAARSRPRRGGAFAKCSRTVRPMGSTRTRYSGWYAAAPLADAHVRRGARARRAPRGHRLL